MLFVLGFPVVFAILIPSIAYIAWSGIPLATVAQRVLYALDSFPLVAVPVFIFVGNLMNAAGITEKIYHFANTLAGRLPGGLAQVNIVGSLIFSGVSGAALADVGGIGRIEIKAMKDEGFPVPFAAALTGASAIVGPIFPPSIPVIIYAAATSISAIQLLVAGIIPALICVAMLMIATAIVAYPARLSALGALADVPRAVDLVLAGLRPRCSRRSCWSAACCRATSRRPRPRRCASPTSCSSASCSIAR